MTQGSLPYSAYNAFPGAVMIPAISFQESVRKDWQRSGFMAYAALSFNGFQYHDPYNGSFSTADNKEVTANTLLLGVQYVTNPAYRQALDTINAAEQKGEVKANSSIIAFNRIALGNFGDSEFTRYLPGQTE